MPTRDSDSLINNVSSNQKSQQRGPSPRKPGLHQPPLGNGNVGKIDQIIEKNKKLMDKYNVTSAK